MNRSEYTAKLTEVAEELGFTMRLNGSGHWTMTHTESGRTCIAPSTPSEYRGWQNMVNEMERISGKKLPRPNHRRSRKKNETSGYLQTYLTDAQRATSDRIEELKQEHSDAKVWLMVTASGPCTREEINRAAIIIKRIVHLETVLTEMRQPFEKYTPIPSKYTL